jgi:outer membrane protein assembly factor BamB
MAKLGRTGGGGGYPGPRCTPAVDTGMVYALGQHGDVLCAEAATGKEVWRKNLRKDFSGRVGGWGYSESPLVDGDKLLCTPGGTNGAVVALNKKTGELIWRSADFKDSAEYSSIIVEEIGGVRQYIQFTGASVAGLAADSGKLLWRAERRGRTATIPTPIYKDNHVYVASGYGVGCNLFKITPGSKFKAEEVYKNNVMVNHHGGVILHEDHLYGYSDGKGWVCQNFKTGDMVWSDKKLGKGSISYADGHLVLRDEGGSGTIVLIEASPDAYKEKGRFDQPDRSDKRSWPHPVIAGGKLYVRDQDLLLCYDVKQK